MPKIKIKRMCNDQSTSTTEVSYSYYYYYYGDKYDNIRLEHGLIHLTREAAQLYLEALLSFTSDK